MKPVMEKIYQLDWDYPNPFTVSVKVSDKDIDQLGHTNNQVYLDWMMKAAYGHSESLGLSVNDYLSIGVAMVAKRHEINYMSATFLNDNLIVGTWIATIDFKVCENIKSFVLMIKKQLCELKQIGSH